MFTYIRNWFQRTFADPQVVFIFLFLVGLLAALLILGQTFAPLIAALIFAYLLEGLVAPLERKGMPRLPAVLIVFTLFMIGLALVVFALIPLLYRQIEGFLRELPGMISQVQDWLLLLPQQFPEFMSEDQIIELMAHLRREAANMGQRLLALSFSVFATLGVLVVYLVLTPLMVFFLLKDKRAILAWIEGYLPKERTLANQVWRESNRQIGNYIRGKFWEILIVSAITYVTFMFLGLEYAPLLAVMVGLSVLIPYIGAIVITIPITLVALLQPDFDLSNVAYVLIAYAIIQAVDANIIFPLLFSRVVNLHPIAIILAILFFGSIWGFWGIFFAVPLATCIQAVLEAWPREQETESPVKRHEPLKKETVPASREIQNR